jgi:hypothetical protein
MYLRVEQDIFKEFCLNYDLIEKKLKKRRDNI